jgi:hypothetical protein
MAAWLVIVILLHFAQAQFIQRYNTQNGKPHWRRQIGKGFENYEVLQPDTPVYLEYNCQAMPSICLNVQSWMKRTKQTTWKGRAGQWVFTYDMYASEKNAYTQGTRSSAEKANRQHR